MVNVSFLPVELKSLDRLSAQLLVLSVFEDERPLRGLSGLVDWRTCGMLSRFLLRGHVTGEQGEVTLFPLNHRFRIPRGLIFGLGPRRDFLPRDYDWICDRIAHHASRLGARSVALSLPGFSGSELEPDGAVDSFTQAAGRVFSRITLFSTSDEKRELTQLIERHGKDFEVTAAPPAPQLLGGSP